MLFGGVAKHLSTRPAPVWLQPLGCGTADLDLWVAGRVASSRAPHAELMDKYSNNSASRKQDEGLK